MPAFLLSLVGGPTILPYRNSSNEHSRLGVSLTAFLLFLAAAFGVQAEGEGEGEGEDQPAELMPLAAESLLLDVTDAGELGLVAVGERGHVVISKDGETWTQAESVPTRSTLTSVTHHGGRLWAAGHDTIIISSTDGGRNWDLQYFEPDRQQAVMDIHFMDADNGLAMGAYGLMLVTSDGGESWDDHYVSDEEWHLNALQDLGGGHLVIAGEAGFSYVSRDGGDTWAVIEMPYLGSMFGIAPAGDCLVVFGLRGNVQESCDGGDTWTEQATGTELTLSGGATENGRLLMAGNSGAILFRNADGQFEVASHSSGVDFAAAVALGKERFLLVGEEGVHRYPEQDEP